MLGGNGSGWLGGSLVVWCSAVRCNGARCGVVVGWVEGGGGAPTGLSKDCRLNTARKRRHWVSCTFSPCHHRTPPPSFLVPRCQSFRGRAC